MKKKIQLAHGGGGRASSQLIDEEIISRFGNGPLKGLPDAASLNIEGEKLLFSTDSFVVQPVEFPGGNIGDLAVHGTVNDISVAGGKPEWISLALILEEGLEIGLLRRILDSVKDAADNCGVKVVTGDTKVVARGQCDKIFINTAGIGIAYPDLKLDADRIEIGDKVLVSGPIGDHGLAVMSLREGINIQDGPKSDSAPVHRLVSAAREVAPEAIKFMRDPTRGGVATVLNEIVADQEFGITLNDLSIPLNKGTKAVAEILGFDPLNIACEGRMLCICSESEAEAILTAWKAQPEGQGAAIIGQVNSDSCKVTLQTLTGGRRMVNVPQGDLLPRIC